MPDPPVPAGPGRSGPRLRVRPPTPLSSSTRIAVAVGAVLVLVLGAAFLQSASAADQGRTDVVAQLDRFLPPRGAALDTFDGAGSLTTDGGLPWVAAEGSWIRQGGSLVSQGASSDVALVDVGQLDVLLDALVVSAEPGSGLVLADGPDDRLELVVDGQGSGWELVRTLSGRRAIVQLVTGPVADVVVQVVRLDGKLRIDLNREQHEIALTTPPLSGTSVGLVAQGVGTRIDRFAYLPLHGG